MNQSNYSIVKKGRWFLVLELGDITPLIREHGIDILTKEICENIDILEAYYSGEIDLTESLSLTEKEEITEILRSVNNKDGQEFIDAIQGYN